MGAAWFKIVKTTSRTHSAKVGSISDILNCCLAVIERYPAAENVSGMWTKQPDPGSFVFQGYFMGLVPFLHS